MVSLLEKLAQVGVDTSYLATKEGTLVDEDLLLRDADTYLTTEGNPKGVRVAGVDAPEVQHLGSPKTKEFDFDYQGREQSGGLETHEFANKLVTEEGFNRPVTYQKDRIGPSWLTGSKDDKGIYGRDLGDLRNEEGEYLSSRLISSGITPTDRYTEAGSAHQLQSAVGGLRRAERAAAGEQTDDDMFVRGLEQLKNNSGVEQFGTELLAKNFAANEDVYGAASNAGLSHLYTGVEFRDYDRTKKGEVRGWQLDDAWDMAKKSGVAGIYTSLGMIGEALNIDSAQNFFYGHKDRLKREISRGAKLRNAEAFDNETGEWKLDGIIDFIDYASVNLASSAPVMLTTMAAVATAIPTYGASLTIPVSIYTGQNYDAQPEDNESMQRALGIGVLQTGLDIIGVKVGGGLLAASLTSKPARAQIISEVAKQQNISKGAAEIVLTQAIKGRMADVVKLSQEQIEKGLRTKTQQLQQAGVAVTADSLIEGGTEALQEVLGVYAEGNNDWENLNNRLLNSFFAGATLGGGFTAAGQASQGFDQYNYQKGLEEETQESAARNALVIGYDEGRADTFEARRLNDNAKYENIKAEVEGTDTITLRDLANLEPNKKEVPVSKITKFKDSVNSLWKGQIKQAFENHNTSGPIISRLSSTLGGNRDRAGSTNEEYQQQLSGKYEGKENFDADILVSKSGLGTFKNLNKHLDDRKATYTTILNKAAKQGKPVSAIVEPSSGLANWEIDFLDDLADSNAMATRDADGFKVDLLAPVFNASNIYRDSDKFSSILQSKGYKKAEADKLALLASNTDAYNGLVGSSEYDNINPNSDSGFEVTLNDLDGLTKDPDFAEFLQHNIFNTIATNSTKAAARAANNTFIGAGGSKLASDLNKAYSAGEITYNERIVLAKRLQDYVEQLSGTYNFIPSKGYNKTVNLITTYAIINHLGKAAASSMPEWATGRYVNNPSRNRLHQDFSKYAKESARLVKGYLQDNANTLGISKAREDSLIDNRATIRELGYLQDQQSPAARVGGEYSPQQAIWVSEFMKFIGLPHITEGQRMFAAGAAVDNVRHWSLQYALNQFANNGKPNKLASRARSQLLNLGINPERAADIQQLESLSKPKTDIEAEQIAQQLAVLKAPQMKRQNQGDPIQSEPSWDEVMKTAVIRQVDTAVAMPRKGNRPALYNDPRWRLLTLFTGYSSTVTANLLPTIARNLFGSESLPAERADAVKSIAGMIALAYLGQAIKEAVFGQEDWLEDDPAKWYVNLLYQSGLAGTFQRPIDALFPLYGQGRSVTGDAVGGILPFLEPPVDFVISESPGLSSVDNIAKAIGNQLTDDDNKVRNTVKILPGFNAFKDILAPYQKE